MKGINILIEGSDGAGKSTTIQYLQMLLEWPVVKGSDFSHAAQGNEYLFNKFYKLTDLNNFIFDRCHISNLVYAQLYKDYSILTPEQVQLIEDRLRNESMVFYLYADLDVVINRVVNRGDDYVKVDMIKKIRDKYDEVLSQSTLKIVRIDTTEIEPLDVAKEILRHAGFATDS